MIDGQVTDDPGRSRYEIRIDDEVAGWIDYRDDGGVRTMVHTEVPAEWEGHGVGSALVGGALDDVRAHDLRVRPQCPFVAQFVQQHPQYADLLASRAP